MKLDAAEIDDPNHSRRLVDNNFVGRAAGRKRQRDSAQPLRMILRRTLLVEHLALGPVDKTLQHDRTIANTGERAGRDRQVILDELEFGELRVEREIWLVRIRDANFASVDRQNFFLGFCHGSEWFRHVDEVTGDSGRHVRGKRRRTALDVTALLIERRQFFAKADDKDVHRV
jgi:hypothetical protein